MSRYIDADKLKEFITTHDYRLSNKWNVVDKGMFTGGILMAIDELPTADVRENVKGEWISHIEDDGYIECPFCQHATNCDSTEEQRELHYCFYCGAELK